MAHPIADDPANPTQQRTVLLATDNKNSVLAEVVADKTNHIAYSAYGHQSAQQQQVATSLGFNGELREARIGWYLLGNGYRAYNPRLMRFHSPDSWSPFGRGGLNPYMYCVGDPINRSDPTGHVIKPFFKFLSGVDKFFFGGSGVTGSSRTKALMSTAGVEAIAGTMRPEPENILKAFDTLGTVAVGAPGPRGTSSPPIHNVQTTPKHHPGYVAGARGDGLTALGDRSTTRLHGGAGGGGWTMGGGRQRGGRGTPPRSSFDDPRTLYAGPPPPKPVLVNEKLLGGAPHSGPPQPPPPAPPQPPSSSSSSSTSRDSTPPRSRNNSGGNNARNFDDIALKLRFLRR